MPLLVAQMGHVARTRGATGGPHEQATARAVATLLDGLLPHAGWDLSTIAADEPSSRYAGDAFVAIHCDASASPAARGASAGWRTPEGRALAAAWKAAYAKHGWPGSFRADNYTAGLSGYYGHRHAVAAGNPRAVIVELGFTTNPTERDWIVSPSGRRTAALSIVEAVTGSVPGPAQEPSEEDTIMTTVQLKAGDEGPRVAAFQRALAGWRDSTSRRGREQWRLNADGRWGPYTTRLWAEYGRASGLDAEPWWDPQVLTTGGAVWILGYDPQRVAS